jgi:hypothetical protein
MIEPNGTSFAKKSSRTFSVTMVSFFGASATAVSGELAADSTPPTAASTPPATDLAIDCAARRSPASARSSELPVADVAMVVGLSVRPLFCCTIFSGTPMPPSASEAPRAQVVYFFFMP